ncbi:MAG: hypothetical protein U0744_18550 [Gemmataceae bacterium]
MIGQLDAEMPRIRAADPDVLIVTGDHSTPSKLKNWLASVRRCWGKYCRRDAVVEFGESYYSAAGWDNLSRST